jgi:hypothetical protein
MTAPKALRTEEVFGREQEIQRCRNHKIENVMGELPKEQQDQTRRLTRAAFQDFQCGRRREAAGADRAPTGVRLRFGGAESTGASPKVAAILPVVESCRRLGVPVKDYLAAVLPGLNRRALPEVSNLTPARWSAARV